MMGLPLSVTSLIYVEVRCKTLLRRVVMTDTVYELLLDFPRHPASDCSNDAPASSSSSKGDVASSHVMLKHQGNLGSPTERLVASSFFFIWFSLSPYYRFPSSPGSVNQTILDIQHMMDHSKHGLTTHPTTSASDSILSSSHGGSASLLPHLPPSCSDEAMDQG